MSNTDEPIMTPSMAAEVLRLEPPYSPDRIRAAYLAAVRTTPPETDQAGFQAITLANQVLSNTALLADWELENLILLGSATLRPEALISRSLKPVGPEPWIALIREGG